jgi:outer membrane protein OmpA-like peptidoglycan-associated protein
MKIQIVGNMIRSVYKTFIILTILLIFTSITCYAQEDNTVTSDELIDFFSPSKQETRQQQHQPPSGRRGVGGVRQGHSGSPAQEGSYNYEPQYAPQQVPQETQYIPPQTQQAPQQVPQYPSQQAVQQPYQQMEQTGAIQVAPEARKSFQNILFDVNAYTIKDSSYRQLDEIGKALTTVMKQYPDAFFVIEGHTDSSGSAAHNERLSTRRAEMVRDFLVFKYGLDNRRIMAVGYGENRPVASNDNQYGRSMNRRVEVVRR